MHIHTIPGYVPWHLAARQSEFCKVLITAFLSLHNLGYSFHVTHTHPHVYVYSALDANGRPKKKGGTRAGRPAYDLWHFPGLIFSSEGARQEYGICRLEETEYIYS